MDVETAAPVAEQAPPPAAETTPEIPASHAAVAEDDFSKFQAARRAERSGKPLAAVEAPKPEAAADTAPEGQRPPDPNSKRTQQREAATRTAVYHATRDLQAENARLRALVPPEHRAPAPFTPPPQAPAPTLKEPDPTDAAKYPLGEFDPKYQRDIARYDTEQFHAQRSAEARAESERTQTLAQAETSAKAIGESFKTFETTSPDLAKEIDDELLKTLVPRLALKDPRTFGPRNAIAEEMLASPDTAPQLAHYLSTHPEELARLEALQPRALIRELGRIEGRFTREAAAAAPVPPTKTLTDAPTSGTTLGRKAVTETDPERAAVMNDDFEAFQRTRRERRAATLRR